MTPAIPVTNVRANDTHRLIPSKYSASKYGETGTVLSRLTDDDPTLDALIELDGATNDRLLGEEGLLPGIGVHELVFGVGYAHIVNAAFTHAAPDGGRFNSSQRGAWYAGIERETSIAEVGYHKLRQLEEIDWPHEEVSTCDDYLADFSTELHDLRRRQAEYKAAPPAAAAARVATRHPNNSPPIYWLINRMGLSTRVSVAKAEHVSSASVPRWSTTFGKMRGLRFG